MSSFPEEAFRRTDEAPDEEFYRTPRLVTHLDDQAIAAVTQLYRELFPAGGEILDLMSSWVSHLPPEVAYRRVVGLGMNEVELCRNERLDSYIVQNLNTNPGLPFGEGEFDGIGICVSIDYLTRPVEVLREVGRVLKVGAPLITTFSNRWFSHESDRDLAPSGRPGAHAPRRRVSSGSRQLPQSRPESPPPLLGPALRGHR